MQIWKQKCNMFESLMHYLLYCKYLQKSIENGTALKWIIYFDKKKKRLRQILWQIILIYIWYRFGFNSIEMIQLNWFKWVQKMESIKKTESIENNKYSVQRKNIRTMTIILNEWRDNMLVNFSLACSYWNRVIFAKYICENVQLHCLNWLVHASCNWQFGSHPKMSFFD